MQKNRAAVALRGVAKITNNKTNNKMKKVTTFVLITVLSVGLFSCNEQRKSANKENKLLTINESKMGTIKLNKVDFLTKVMDYEKNPTEWKYLGDKPAIIDFYADWCGPCRMVAPVLEELAKEYADKIYIYKVDTEKEQELAGLFQIQSIPSILFIPMKGQPQMAMGALPKGDLKKAIEEVLLK